MPLRRIRRLATIGFLTLAASLPAQSKAITDLFPKAPTGFVTDSAALLSPAMRTTLADSIRALQASVGADIAVVTLPSLGERAAADVALAIGRA
jgi:uncharacterized membrane protein YgcG